MSLLQDKDKFVTVLSFIGIIITLIGLFTSTLWLWIVGIFLSAPVPFVIHKYVAFPERDPADSKFVDDYLANRDFSEYDGETSQEVNQESTSQE